jgi:hypothetical protein
MGDSARQSLLATDYFHVVFTVPHELNVLALENPQVFYDLLFTASAQTLLEVAADPDRKQVRYAPWAESLRLASVLIRPRPQCPRAYLRSDCTASR